MEIGAKKKKKHENPIPGQMRVMGSVYVLQLRLHNRRQFLSFLFYVHTER